MRAYACSLGVLSLVFAARVLGQLLVAFFDVEFLPPMEAWYSGLIPYPALLATQLVILAVQLEISGVGPSDGSTETQQIWTGFRVVR